MAGVYLGGAALQIPVLIDGFISKLIQNKMCCRFFGHMTGNHIIRCLRAKSGCYKSGNSGKSAFAEDKIVSFGPAKRIYIATMHPYDEESHKRLARHQKMRAGKGFETVECYTGLKNLDFPENAVVLLECMSNLAANEMFEEKGAGEKTVEAVLEGIKKLSSQVRHLVIVTNEIFSEAASYEGDTIRYQEYLGIINQNIGKMADEVVEVVYGIPIWHKGGKIIENAVE